MYKVLCDSTLIYNSENEELALIDPVVELEENCAGSFSFSIPPTHPYYDLIQKRKSVLQVYQDEELIFSGMPIETKTDFYKQKNVYCEGELSYLNDSIQRPARYQGITVRGLLEAYINSHNAQVEEEKQFTVGMVTVTDPNDSIYCYTNMESTMQCLKEDLVDDLGGYFRIRHENGVKYIDYLADSMHTCEQVIELGKNLIDFNSNIDSSDIATAIIPLGERLEESPIEGLEVRLDIKSVNDDLDYVHSAEAVQNYGWIYKTVVWDNVTTASALKAKGEEYLSSIQFENMIIEAKAVDLHFIDSDEERFRLSDQIRVVSSPHGLNRNFRLTKQTINLNSPENDTITLGKEERVTLSAKTNQANEAIYKAMENIVPPSTILAQAEDNATQLITNALGGYVVMNDTNNDGHPDEILIMDTANTDTATKVWRWNQNGLGYSSTGYNGQYGTAMTMDGTIVADFVKTGSMSADRVRGGTLEIGGSGFAKDGTISVKNSSNTEIVKIDKTGLYSKKASVQSDDGNHYVTMKTGVLYGGVYSGGIEDRRGGYLAYDPKVDEVNWLYGTFIGGDDRLEIHTDEIYIGDYVDIDDIDYDTPSTKAIDGSIKVLTDVVLEEYDDGSLYLQKTFKTITFKKGFMTSVSGSESGGDGILYD